MKLILTIFLSLFFLINSCDKGTEKTPISSKVGIDKKTISPKEGVVKLFVAEDIFNQKWVDTLMPIRNANFYEFKHGNKDSKKYSYILDYSSNQNPIYGTMESNTYIFEKIDLALIDKLIAENNKTILNGIEYLVIETDEFNLPFKSCKTFALLNPKNKDFKGFTINYIKENKLIQSKILFNKFFPIDWDIAVNKLNKL